MFREIRYRPKFASALSDARKQYLLAPKHLDGSDYLLGVPIFVGSRFPESNFRSGPVLGDQLRHH